MECRTLHDYISGRLNEADQMRFEQHLAGCESCRREHQLATTLDTFIEEWTESHQRGGPTLVEADTLVELVKSRRKSPWRLPALGWVGGIAGAAAALLLVLYLVDHEQPAPPVAPSAPVQVAIAPSGLAVEVGLRELVEGESLKTSAMGEALAVVDNDLLGVGHSSHIEVIETKKERTRLNLHSGHAVFDVHHRTEGSHFAIQVGPWSVRVIGTRFGIEVVEGGGLELTVAEGTVQVLRGDDLLGTVTAGGVFLLREGYSAAQSPANDTQLATIARMVPPEMRARYLTDDAGAHPEAKDDAAQQEKAALGSTPKAAPHARGAGRAKSPVEVSRQALLAGDYATARGDLEAYLKKAPGDHHAWSLLGDCHRKLDNHRQAVAAYEQAIRLGNNGEANRARFMAATVLQGQLGDHRQAAELFESYIAKSYVKSSMHNVAKLRLARSYAALGDKLRAKKQLKEIIIDDPQSFVARNARRLLGEL